MQEELIPLLRELGIGIVAYSPLGRGMLSGEISKLADLNQDDLRRCYLIFLRSAESEAILWCCYDGRNSQAEALTTTRKETQECVILVGLQEHATLQGGQF